MKAIIVARVSTEEQREAGSSLPAQLNRMQEYCKRHNYEIAHTFSYDESAYKTKRDEFDKIVEIVNASKGKIILCFDKVDRLSRNIFDKRVAHLYEKAVANEIELHFVSDTQVINNSMNAGDKFAFGMKLGLSKYYSDAISDNTKRAFEQKRRNGEWTGPVRIGYLNVPADSAKRLRKDIIIDPVRGPLIKQLFELYASGNYSITTAWEKITEMGLSGNAGQKLSRSNIDLILKDPFYYGVMKSKKYGLFPHGYAKLIQKELFDRCQDVFHGRSKHKSKMASNVYIFKGLAPCADCGCLFSPETHKGHIYYTCTNAKGFHDKRPSVREEVLLEPIYELLGRFGSITEEVQNELVTELRKTTETEVVFHRTQLSRINADYERTKQKSDNLLDLYIDKSITKQDYDTKHQEYY